MMILIISWVKKNHLPWFLLVTLAILIPRGLDLDRFVTTDETPWLMRSGNFYYALGQRNFQMTDQGVNPGVTTMWVNTAAFLWQAPEYRGFGQGYFKDYSDFEEILLEKGINAHAILISGRMIMLVENTFLLLVAFWLAIRLFGLYPALAGFLLLAFDPFHISLTVVSHMDGQLGSLMLVSLLAFLSYFQERQKILYIVISALTAGLACLTKLPAYLLFPVFGLIAVIAIISSWKKVAEMKQLKAWLGHLFRHLSLWLIIFAGVYVILWPAMWVNPVGTFVKQVSAPLKLSERGNLFDGENKIDLEEGFAETADATLNKLAFYPRWYLRLETPVIISGILISLMAFLIKIPPFDQKNRRSIVTITLAFAGIYTLGIGFIDKHNSRYMIPAAIVLTLFAGMGWVAFTGWVNRLKNIAFKLPLIIIMIAFVIVFQLGAVIQTYPYYYSYFNPLMGGSRAARELVLFGSGEGLDEAGRYLSKKTGAKNLTVLSWYGSGCFSYYFPGKTINIPTGITNNEFVTKNLENADYLVTYINQWNRRIPPELFDILDQVPPEHSIWIDGIEYARIYEVSELPPGVFEYSEK